MNTVWVVRFGDEHYGLSIRAVCSSHQKAVWFAKYIARSYYLKGPKYKLRRLRNNNQNRWENKSDDVIVIEEFTVI